MAAVYEASHINTRMRATKAQMEDRYASIHAIVAEQKPMTVRQVFYQCTVRGVVEKTELGYLKVQQALVKMRRNVMLPYGWLADKTRWQRKPSSYDTVDDALEDTARFYRKNLWRDADCYVKIWLEKDALSGGIYPVTAKFDGPPMAARGYASLSFLPAAAEDITSLSVPAPTYQPGDSVQPW